MVQEKLVKKYYFTLDREYCMDCMYKLFRYGNSFNDMVKDSNLFVGNSSTSLPNALCYVFLSF